MSRAALICAVVPDAKERATLLAYQNVRPVESPEVVRWRDALAKLPRSWDQWKAEVPVMPKTQVKRAAPVSRANYGAGETNRVCRCGSIISTVNKTVQTGRVVVRYRVCQCGQRRTSREILPTK